MLAALLLATALAAPPAPLTAAALRTRYGNLAALSADVTQVKEGRFWARPMRSQIKLRWTQGRIEWETVSPVRSLVTIEGEALSITDSHGQPRSLGANGDPRFKALITMLRAFLSLDLPAIERDFTLEYAGLDLVARLRPEAAVRVFSTLRFRFDERLELIGLELVAESERTTLTFDNVVRDVRKAAAAP
jgi:hypothetical protein